MVVGEGAPRADRAPRSSPPWPKVGLIRLQIRQCGHSSEKLFWVRCRKGIIKCGRILVALNDRYCKSLSLCLHLTVHVYSTPIIQSRAMRKMRYKPSASFWASPNLLSVLWWYRPELGNHLGFTVLHGDCFWTQVRGTSLIERQI